MGHTMQDLFLLSNLYLPLSFPISLSRGSFNVEMSE
jgi:hypothetical protein